MTSGVKILLFPMTSVAELVSTGGVSAPLMSFASGIVVSS